jgi:predicted dienelactone hydrolase
VTSNSSERLSRRRALLGLGACLAGPGWAAGDRPDPLPVAPSGPLDVDPARFAAIDLDWTDAARQRAVPVRLYQPAGPARETAGADGRRSLVVFSHGIGSSRRGYSYLGAYLAAQGHLALHVQHVGSDRQVWMGNPFGIVARLQAAARESEALQRVQDVRFALDRLLDSEQAAEIAPERILMAGHSYGANTSLLLAGARVVRAGQPLPLADPRLRAAVLISAPPFYREPTLRDILAPVHIPTLHITATEDVIQVPGYHSPPADRIQVYEATGSPLKALAVFEGGSHSIFTDRGVTGGIARNPQVKRATRELVKDFMDLVFAGQGAALRDWPQRHQPLLNRWQLDAPASA